MAEINEFDNQLRDALSNLGENISPEGWDAFAEKLSATDGLSTLNDPASFDEIVRNRMDGLEVNADPYSWDALEYKIDQELNAPTISDEALDQFAADNLSNLYIPYNPTHWTLMSHRLEEEFNVRRKIFTYKLAEFSLMLLLLLTIIQFLPSYPSSIDKVVTNNEVQTVFLEKHEIINPVASVSNFSNSEEKIVSNSPSTETSSISGPVRISNNPPAIISDIEEKIITSVAFPIPSKIVSVEISKDKKTIQQSLEIVVAPEQTSTVVVDEPTSPLQELPITIATLNQITDLSKIGVLKKFRKKVVFRLGAMASADLNKVKTPRSSPFKNNGYQQTTAGYAGGIILDLTYEKFTINTGLIYRRINFYQQEQINIDGSFANGYQSTVFDEANLNLLTIPINFQFQMNNSDRKWKLHAITGASINVLALNHYNITVNNLGRNTTSRLAVPPPSLVDPGNNNPAELVREASIAGEGLFEGGSFNRNHYFTANFGFGVERFISQRWSLFLQPIYQHEVFGKNLGINRDRISTISLQVGAKSTFK